MKTLIVYDSLYSNTKKIAEAIGEAISEEVKTLHVKDVNIADLVNYDLLIVGSPTHAGRPTEPIKMLLKNISNDLLKNKYIAAFDTRASSLGQGWFVKMLINILGYAAIHIQKGLEKKGGQLAAAATGFMVKGKEGPLEETEIKNARQWGREIYQKASNKITKS